MGASVESTAGSRGVRISFSNAGYTTFGGGVRVLATHSIRKFPLHFPSRASPCATRFRTSSTAHWQLDIGDGEEMCRLVMIRVWAADGGWGMDMCRHINMWTVSLEWCYVDNYYCVTFVFVCSTDIHRLTTGIRSEKHIVRRFRRYADVIVLTQT